MRRRFGSSVLTLASVYEFWVLNVSGDLNCVAVKIGVICTCMTCIRGNLAANILSMVYFETVSSASPLSFRTRLQTSLRIVSITHCLEAYRHIFHSNNLNEIIIINT